MGTSSGHAAALLGARMFVAGGGNNSAGCADLFALDMSQLGAGSLAWSAAGRVDARSPVASEGLSLASARSAGALVAFGGYNGKYHNSVQVYRPGAPLLDATGRTVPACCSSQVHASVPSWEDT